MTQEEKDALLEEAKRRYPVGTLFKSVFDCYEYTVRNGVYFCEYDGESIIDNEPSAGNYIYYKGKWATIVSTPQPQFEVGKWYYFEAFGDRCSNIAKCTTYRNDGLISNQWIMLRDKIHHGNGSWGYYSMHNIREATLSEIQQYLPEGHPDKFVAAKDEEWIPKVGELAVFNNAGLKGICTYGKAYKIDSIDSDGCVIHTDDNGRRNGYKSIHYRKALPHEIPGNEQYKQILINNSQLNVKQNGTNQKGNIIEVCAAYPEIISGKRRRAEVVESRGCEVQVRARPKRNPQSINA